MAHPAPEAEGRPRWLGYLQLALILAAVAIALYFARAPERADRVVAGVTVEQHRPAVTVVRPTPTEHALTVHLTGSVTLDRKASLVSEVDGRVIWVSPKFSAGGTLEEGETFVRIDPAEFELRVEAARLAVREAEVLLAQRRDEFAEVHLEKARNALRLAELRLRKPPSRSPTVVAW